jgi:tetratricopeptide (TPR) repeat protein
MRGFVGRERELQDLCDRLRDGESVALAAAVADMGGVGKSALAIEVVHRLAADPRAFPGGITWVRCDDRTDLSGLLWVYDQLLTDWHIALSTGELKHATTPEEELEVRERALEERLYFPNQSIRPLALVLLDNVEQAFPLSRLLDRLAICKITALITTRSHPSSPQLLLWPLDVLDHQSAINLFARRYQDRQGNWDAERDTQDAADVVQTLGHLPLAIELAAARAAMMGTGVAALAEELCNLSPDPPDDPPDQPLLDTLNDPLDATRSIRTSFGKSLALLTPAQRVRFAVLGLPDGPDWPRSLVARVLSAVSLNSGGAPSASRSLEDLAAFSLVRLLSISTQPPGAAAARQRPQVRVRLHPLLRELAQEEWEQQPAEMQEVGLKALLAGVSEVVNTYRRDFAALAREEALIAGTLRRAARAEVDLERLCMIIEGLFAYFNVGGHWRVGLELMELRREACSKLGDQVGEGFALIELGVLALNLGLMELTERYDAQALALWREMGGSGQGALLNELGIRATRIGDVQAAANYYQQALMILRDVGDRQGEGEALNNLGLLFTECGRPEEARRYYEQALAIWHELDNQREIGVTLNNLGLLTYALGEYEEAARCYTQALAIRRAVRDRGGEAATLNNWGMLARGMEQWEEAERYYMQALEVAREVGNRRGEGRVLNNLGELFLTRGRLEEAERYYMEALPIRREVQDRQGEGVTLDGLGLLAYQRGRYQEAAAYYEQALTIRREVQDRPGEGRTLHRLGLLAQAMGHYQEAAAYYKQALDIRREVQDRPGINETLDSLRRLTIEQGQRQSENASQDILQT